MSIRIANSCVNCENFKANLCAKHEVNVSTNYTCDSFQVQTSLLDGIDCLTCTRFETSSCQHPAKATKGMLCSKWAPLGA